ncbi:MAG: T9SS type A sorting domain-containing protein [Saprospiraceae bacterium]|nr:T9SS type A sorting domain-containing protein [Saprospiraceae bacterium]
MKKFLFFLIISFYCLSGQTQTNTYHPFPDSYYWRVDWHCQHYQSNCNERYHYNYYFDGDTIINGNSYKKLMRDSVVLIGIGGPPCTLNPWAANKGYMGALKEDSILNKTYFLWSNLSYDTLLYDYNLVSGDTLKGGLVWNYLIVSSVDSVLIGNGYRKRWNFNSSEGPGYIIQGIGSNNGLIERINSTGFCYSSLVCIKDLTTTLFTSNFSSSYGCQLILPVKEQVHTRKTIHIFPNPTSDYIIIESKNPLNKIKEIKIYNSLGILNENLFPNISDVKIDISLFPNGLYFLIVEDMNGEKSVKKIIVNK